MFTAARGGGLSRPIVHAGRRTARIVGSRILSPEHSMSISMYSASVPVFTRLLGHLLQWLDKAEAHAQAKKFDTSVYLAARLAPGGVLVLGPSEITDWQNDNLEREVYPDTLAFRRRV